MTFLAYPFANILLLLYNLLGQSTVGAIAAFTLLINLAMLPLTLKQQRTSRLMQEMQPELERIKKKYANNREKQAQAMTKLYSDKGVSPFSGCLPLLIQMPIWFSLIGAIRACIPATPLAVFQFSQNIYRFLPGVVGVVPLDSTFLGMDLGLPPSPAQLWSYSLPILVLVTSWLQQKLITPPSSASASDSGEPSMAAQQMRMMQVSMPFLFMFFTLQYPVGLSIYFVLSSVIRVVQYYIVRVLEDRAKTTA